MVKKDKYLNPILYNKYMNPGLSLRATSFQESTIHLARARKGKFPKTVMLAAPHTNEHGAVLLPQAALQRSLGQNGVEVKLRNRLGMMAKLWKMRSMLDREFPNNSRDILVRDLITPLLSAQDFLLRLREMQEFFSKNPDGVFMELHAMNQNVILQSSSLSSKELEEFLQISGTNMLICRKAIRSFGELVALTRKDEADVYSKIQDHYLPQSQGKIKELVLLIKARIEEFCGFSFDNALEGCESALPELKGNEDRIFIVEIPSESRHLAPSHFMHGSYYAPRTQDPGYASLSSSHFEEAYAAYTRESIGFSHKDTEALLNQLKVC